MKIDRLLNILMLLVNKKKVTANELAEQFGVSIRTIQRDIDTLSMAGIPLYAEVGKNGGYQLIDQYKLDKNFLNTNEANVLVAFLKNLQQAAPYTEVKSIFNKFSAILNNEPNNNKVVIKLNPAINEDKFKENIECLSKAREQLTKVKVNYVDAEYKETERILCPYTLVMMGTTWYLYAYCELRQDFRMFKLSRILSCHLLNENFKLINQKTPLPWESNFDSNRSSTKIILEIDRILQGKLPDFFNHKNCHIENDKIIATLNFPVDEWLYSMLLGFVPYIKVTEPNWVKEEFIKRLELGLEINKL